MLSSNAGAHIRLKACIDSSRYFVVQLSKICDNGISSKRSPAIRFGEDAKNPQPANISNSLCP